MNDQGFEIILTKHAKVKIQQRHIDPDDIKSVILKPDLALKDKLDDSLDHFIGLKNKKFLRIIVRRVNKRELLVVSAFYDRRLKGGK